MNTTEINEFIDFTGLFVKLYEEHKEDLHKHRYEAEHFGKIITFYEEGGLNSFDLMREECELSNTEIVFCFGMDLEKPNESSSYVATANYTIVYSRVLHEFTVCEYEQG